MACPQVDSSWISSEHHAEDALSIAFLPPATLVSGGENGEVLVWELGSMRRELPCWVRAASLARCICCLTNQKRVLGELTNEKRV